MKKWKSENKTQKNKSVEMKNTEKCELKKEESYKMEKLKSKIIRKGKQIKESEKKIKK